MAGLLTPYVEHHLFPSYLLPTKMLFSTILSLFAFEALASYDEFYFSAPPIGDNTTFVTCPNVGITCAAPNNTCAHDRVLDKYYCCSGSDYPVCRAFARECQGADGGPSASQFTCENEGRSWCCLEGVESCTQRTGKLGVV